MNCQAAPSFTADQSTWSARSLLQWSCTLRKVSFAADGSPHHLVAMEALLDVDVSCAVRCRHFVIEDLGV